MKRTVKLTATSTIDLQAQRDYEARMRARSGAFAITVGRAFVLGMRQQGYKNTATAIDEFVDNAIQAGARNIQIAFGFGGQPSSNQPTEIAVIDDGHGMDAGMIRLAMTWGGSHRADVDDRSGFGRFGFGLPTAALSQGQAYTVSSCASGDSLRSVRFDVADLTRYVGRDGALEIPKDTEAELPRWVQARLPDTGFEHGTIVMLERLDNHSWKTASSIKQKLLRHLGLYYRHYLDTVRMRVDGEVVMPVDPLFLMEGASLTASGDLPRPEAWSAVAIPVKDRVTGKEKGVVRVRYSFMPYGFAAGTDFDPTGSEEQRSTAKARFQILKENRGIIFTRHGRQLGVLDPPRAGSDGAWFDMIPVDIHWGCEIDFPPSLDEEFGVTTSKQGVRPTERIWDILKEHGVAKTCLQMRYNRRSQAKAGRQPGPVEAIVENVMVEISAAKRRKFLADDQARIDASNENLEAYAAQLSKQTGFSCEAITAQLNDEIARRPYVVDREAGNEGPFYRLESRGAQRRLILNTDHPFCDFYDSCSDQTKWMALLLLYVIADAEMDHDRGQYKEDFYVQERSYWSNNLRLALERVRRAGVEPEEISAAEGGA